MQQRRFQHNRTIINSVACPQSLAKKRKKIGTEVPLRAERVLRLNGYVSRDFRPAFFALKHSIWDHNEQAKTV